MLTQTLRRSLRFPFSKISAFLSVLGVLSVPAVLSEKATAAAADIASPPALPATAIQMLSGHGPEDAVPWEFFCTAGRNSRTWSKIAVPSCWELQGFGTYNYGGESNADAAAVGNEQGLYRHTFSVPAAWKDQRVRIVFDGVMTDATVWINGQLAGETHQGAFYRFHYDITSLIQFGAENRLEVTVAKVSGNRSVNNAERAADYWIFGGIFRPVWLEARPAVALERVAIDARADGSFAAEVHLTAPLAANTALLRAEAQLLSLDGQPLGAPFRAEFAAGATHTVVRGKLDAPKLWTAETPNLYRVQFTLHETGTAGAASANGRALHSLHERFGFRTIEVRENDGVYLNGTKIVLKGVNRHCFWPETGRTISRERSYADARAIKEANMNAVRCSHYSPDKHFLEACDELGLYVLDELAGWQKSYNTPTGARLIGELIRRDVNHPSILFWDNGNEGGWNTANDGEFAKWDPQQRKVLHPWAIHSGINTDHYEHYESTKKLSAGPQIFMPTEFLHGLYDGGIGAGFRDYWDVMGRSPTVAGGFFWVWADEGVVRVDQNGRIDNAGNQAPDGMVGPHGEKEGSFFAVKEIWSPVIVRAPAAEKNGGMLPREWDGVLEVENAYDFTNLSKCSLSWEVISVPLSTRKREVVARGKFPRSDVAPRRSGTLKLELPDKWPFGSALHVTARGPAGEVLWTWSWGIAFDGLQIATAGITRNPDRPELVETAEEFTLRFKRTEIRIDKATGTLNSISTAGERWPLGRGPHLIAFRHRDRRFASVAEPFRVGKFEPTLDVDAQTVSLVVAFRSPHPFTTTWSILPDGSVWFGYELFHRPGASEGLEADLFGLGFDLPASTVRSKRWLGRGPYAVWRNRREGGTFDVHEVAYNDPVPGESYAYPEFKGCFRDWQWLTLRTTTRGLTLDNIDGSVPYLGLYAPKDGVKGLWTLPEFDLAFLEVIPAIGTKFQTPESTGPQGKTPIVSGEIPKRGIRIQLEP